MEQEGEKNTNEKLREALKDIHAEIAKYCNGKTVDTSLCLRVKNIINAALALPRRNCDVGTAKEQSRRFVMFCYRLKQEKCGVCHRACPCYEVSGSCRLAWAQLPYEKEGEARREKRLSLFSDWIGWGELGLAPCKALGGIWKEVKHET